MVENVKKMTVRRRRIKQLKKNIIIPCPMIFFLSYNFAQFANLCTFPVFMISFKI